MFTLFPNKRTQDFKEENSSIGEGNIVLSGKTKIYILILATLMKNIFKLSIIVEILEISCQFSSDIFAYKCYSKT